MNFKPARIAPFMLLSAAALLFGLWAGLLRMGWNLPPLAARLPVQHGPLMISGFLGTLIALERVAALRRGWMYAAPILSGLGWLAGLAFPGLIVSPVLITLASAVLVAIFGVIVRRETQPYTLAMAAGSLCWLVGNILWLVGLPIPQMVWWWAAFLVLTVTGERVELSRVLGLTRRHYRLFAAAAGVFGLGVVVFTPAPEVGARLIGVGLVALAVWLERFDIARRNLRHPAPLTRFIARALFAAYAWLLVGGLLNLIYGYRSGGPVYDALLHAVLVGFVFSMIFGHAPMIVPALTGLKVPFRPAFYAALWLLHASLVMRVAGDLLLEPGLRRWGGLLNEVAIVGYLVMFIISAVRAKNK